MERKCAEKTAASGKMDQQCSREDVVGAVAAGAGAQGVATPAGAAAHQ